MRRCSTLLWLLTGSCLLAAPPKPLVEFLFGRHLRNSGRLGGEGELAEPAPGEGIRFGVGHPGPGLDTRAARRGGGGDRIPAGGAVLFPGEDLPAMESLTACVWFRPELGNSPARLLYLSNRLDLYLGGASVGCGVRHGDPVRDHHMRTPREEPPVQANVWNFLAVVHDGQAKTITCYHGTDSAPLRQVAVWRDVPDPAPPNGPLSVGNLEGIRPFRGLLDTVRLYDQVLTAEQIQERFEGDRRTQSGLFSAAVPAPPPAPFRHGDVLLSSRSKHKNSLETIRAFRPDHLVWSYAHDAAFVAACRKEGVQTFQGTINSIPGTTETEAHVLDFDGKPVIAPWMVAFNPKSPWYWGCHNRPRFLARSLERAQVALDAGADVLQFDDWSLAVSAAGWSASCFCPQCTAGFRDYLNKALTAEQAKELGIADLGIFDYREYLRQHDNVQDAADYQARRRSLPLQAEFGDFLRHSLRDFFGRLRQELDKAKGSRLPLSVNSSLYRPRQRTNCMVDLVDFLQGETWHMGLVDLALACRTAEALGKWQVFVPKPTDLRVARQGIAASYALGQLMIVPWDMYMGSDATGIRPRYYGTPEQYGDLFSFVHANRALFDGMANAPLVGVIVDLDHYQEHLVRQACAMLFRAQVPFTFLPVGHAYYQQPLRGESLARFQYVITACDVGQLVAGDQEVLATVQDDTLVVPIGQVDAADLADFAPLRVWAPEGIVALPRIGAGKAGDRLVIHLLDRTKRPEPTPLKWISILLRDAALGKRAVKSVVWHAPGAPSIPLETERFEDGLRVLIPQLGIWGIADVTFE
ncbi:MAG: LamG domain-containing protein [Victivallales bacterium]|nr:LamG domain-containing protein [Victivallales bacterium]